MDLCNDGIRLVQEASEVFERLGDAVEGSRCLMDLAAVFRQATRRIL